MSNHPYAPTSIGQPPGKAEGKLCIEDIPDEILQSIFLSESTRDDGYLQRLCSVSRRWRSAAISCCDLWTSFPPITFSKVYDPEPERKFDKISNTLRLHLSRSGVLPISFTYAVESTLWSSTTARDLVQSSFKLLTDQVDRWEQVTLKLPYLFLHQMLPPQTKFPILSKLDFQAVSNILANIMEQSKVPFDAFSVAPQLREVKFDGNMAASFFPNVNPYFNCTFPWEQLESFDFLCTSDNSYHTILQHPPPNLKRLRYAAKWIVKELPLRSVTFHRLEVLTLRIRIGDGEIAAHLNTFTLPSLIDLEIRFRDHLSLGVNSLYDAVSSLIQRSGCSLQRLALDPDRTTLAASGLFDILSLSPNITHLDIGDFGAEGLTKLILDCTSTAPVLPKLETLTLRTESSNLKGISRASDAAALMLMVRSRTETLINSTIPNPGFFRTLKKVYFSWVEAGGNVYTPLTAQERLFKFRDADPDPFGETVLVDEGLPAIAWAIWKGPRRHPHVPKNPVPLTHTNMIMGELEDADIGNVNTLLSMRRDVRSIIHDIGSIQDGRSFRRDPISNLRLRAEQLCEKWKPYILSDLRASAYRWKTRNNQACLTWYPPSQRAQDGDDEHIWKGIISGDPERRFPLFQEIWW